jgi:hypothetical protein
VSKNQNNWITFLSIAVGLPVTVVAIVSIVFHFVIGDGFVLLLWPIFGFFLIVGTVMAVIQLNSRTILDAFRFSRSEWEVIRVAGRWPYVLKTAGLINLQIIPPLSLIFLLAPAEPNVSEPRPYIALLLLILITLTGSFLFAWELWKMREREYRGSTVGHSDQEPTSMP